MDEFSESVRVSWGSRLRQSLGSALLGLLLLLCSFPLLWWNEGRSVDRFRTLEQGAGQVRSVASEAVVPGNDGLLVHVSGLVEADEPITDPRFAVTVRALRLRRVVEMYQWVENKRTETTTQPGGSERRETVYSYQRRWRSDLVDSSRFHERSTHRNPATMPYRSQDFTAKTVRLGAFELGPVFTGKLDAYEAYPLNAEPSAPEGFSNVAGEWVHGSLTRPAIGDVRIRFEVVPVAGYSVVGLQANGTLQRFETDTGPLALLAAGRVPAEQLFQRAHDTNVLITWLVRLGGLVAMGLGLAMMLAPLRTLTDVVPFVGKLMGVGIVLLSVVLAVPATLTTIALAWLYFRPSLGITLLVVAGLSVAGGVYLARRASGRKSINRDTVMPESLA